LSFVVEIATLRNDDFRTGAVRVSGHPKRLLELDSVFSLEDLRSLLAEISS
jgi:hypothetical protein